jgi:hypothetical protein
MFLSTVPQAYGRTLLSWQKVSVVDTFRELSNQGFGKIWEFSTRGFVGGLVRITAMDVIDVID